MTKTIPQPREIDHALFNRLIEIQKKGDALDQFISMVTGKGQAMVDELRRAASMTWQEISAKYPDLDVKNINWEPHLVDGKPTLVPTQMRIPK